MRSEPHPPRHLRSFNRLQTGSALLTAYTAATPCTNNNFTTKGNTAVTLTPGVYFISGTLTLKGGSSITGTGVTFILLPGATIDTKGGGTLTLTAPTTAPSTSSLPASLQPDASLFQDMAIYDASVGGRAIRWKQQHQPHRKHVRAERGSDVPGQSDDKRERHVATLIASSIAFNGNATLNFDFNNQDCPAAIQPNSQYVQLVQ